jgi:pseudouridine synthase
VLLGVLGRSDAFLRHHRSTFMASSTSPRQRQAYRSLGVVVGARGKRAAVSDEQSKDNARKGARTLEVTDSDAERTVVLLYHKPPNVVTSHNATNDPLGRRTVYDDVRSMIGYLSSNSVKPSCQSTAFYEVTRIHPTTRLHAVGRLDADTTGLLLLTNDGKLVHRVTNSNTDTEGGSDEGSAIAIDKTYEAVIMGYHNETSPLLESVRGGVDLGPKRGGRTRPPLSLTVLNHPTRTTTLVRLTISEGKNRQVRQMFHRVGSGVMHLKRVRIGRSLTLEGLEEEGSWRVLSDAEVRDKLHWTPRLLEQSSSTSTSFVARSRICRPRKRQH